MSRTRATTDPYWAVALPKMQPGPAGIVRGLLGVIRRSPHLAPCLWLGSGYRTGSTEHSSGRAIDIIITETTGRTPTAAERKAATLLISWLITHAKLLGIQWILHSRDGKPRTESYNPDRGSWKQLSPRGSISANHVDHIHLYFKPHAAWATRLDTAVIGDTKPAPAPKPKPKPVVSLAKAIKAAKTEPDTSGRPMSDKTGTLTIARALVAEGLLAKGYPDGHWGRAQRDAYAAWQRKLGYTGADADGVPGRASLTKLGAKHGFLVA